jgi:hypothetical protein
MLKLEELTLRRENLRSLLANDMRVPLTADDRQFVQEALEKVEAQKRQIEDELRAQSDRTTP